MDHNTICTIPRSPFVPDSCIIPFLLPAMLQGEGLTQFLDAVTKLWPADSFLNNTTVTATLFVPSNLVGYCRTFLQMLGWSCCIPGVDSLD